MMFEEGISKYVKGGIVVSNLSIAGILLNYFEMIHYDFNYEFWKVLMVVQQIAAWSLMLGYLAICAFKAADKNIVGKIIIALFFVAGPFLLVLSGVAYYNEENLHIGIYGLSFWAWWVLFVSPLYYTFKISLDFSRYRHQETTKKQLSLYYQTLNLQSVLK